MTETQLRNAMRREGRDPREIEDLIDQRADALRREEIDRNLELRLQQREQETHD